MKYSGICVTDDDTVNTLIYLTFERFQKKMQLVESSKKSGAWHWILIIGVILVNIKKMFIDFDLDAEYAVTLAYRMAKGDRMFLEMWEPHQTSAFLNAFFIKIWLLVTGTTTGVVLYLNVVGIIFKGIVFLFLYCVLKDNCNKIALFFASVFFWCTNPKLFLVLDYSNMQVFFSILLFGSLLKYSSDRQKKRWLFLAACFLCLDVLAYPSCAILFISAAFFIWKESGKKSKDVFLFTIVCLLAGIAYISWFCFQIETERFLYCIRMIMTGDPTHATSFWAKLKGYGKEFSLLLLLYLICFCIGGFFVQAVWLIRRGKRGSTAKTAPESWYMLGFFCVVLVYWLRNILLVQYQFSFAELYLPFVWGGVIYLKHCDEAERKATLLGISIGIGEVAGTLILTNLSLCNSLPYMVVGLIASFIPISCACRDLVGRKKCEILMSFFCVLAIFANVFVCRAMTFFYMNIFEVRNIVKEGPAIGIFSSYMGPHISNTTLTEWKEHIQPGDNVLIVVKGQGDTGTQSLEYLYENVNICVMDTQTSVSFDERLLAYWEINPDKVPNVVVVDCWFGDLHVDEESWIMQWIYEEFGKENHTDGLYRRYYRKEG